jgi:hypothetical protein
MERMNNLPKGSINQIETDFFEFTSEKKFDIVFSYGFIEHFTDTYNVIKQHVDLTDIKGKILILLPNLKGMSGLFLKWTDQKLFYKHNLDSMDLDLLKNICKSLKLNNVEVKYYGRPHIWINASSKFDNGFVRTMIKYFNGISQRIPLRNKFFAPLIAVKAYR